MAETAEGPLGVDLPDPARHGGGRVVAESSTIIAIASVVARAKRSDELLSRLDSTYGLDARDAAASATQGNFTIWGTAPGGWLLFDLQPAPDWPTGIVDALGDLASVFDQSGAYVLLRLIGPDSGELLQKGLFIDLSDAAFPIGACASSRVAEVAVTVARSAGDQFDIAVPRSYLASFREWLRSAAAAAAIELAE